MFAFVEFPILKFASVEFPILKFAFVEFPILKFAFVEFPILKFAFVEFPILRFAFVEFPILKHYTNHCLRNSAFCMTRWDDAKLINLTDDILSTELYWCQDNKPDRWYIKYRAVLMPR